MDVDLEKKVKHARRQEYTRKRGYLTTYFIPYRGACREICKTQFLHYFNVSRRVAESVANAKAQVAVASTLSPMKSPSNKAMDNKRRAQPLKRRFCKDCRKQTTNLAMLRRHILGLCIWHALTDRAPPQSTFGCTGCEQRSLARLQSVAKRILNLRFP